jgi:serine protease inhibitor
VGTANFSPFSSEGPPAPAITDANGDFTFPLYVSLSVTQGNAGAVVNAEGHGGGPVSVIETVTFTIQGTTYSFTETLSCRLLVCSQNSPEGC